MPSLNLVRGALVLGLLVGYRLGRCAVALLAFAQWIGLGWAVLLTLMLLGVRLTWAIRAAALVGLMTLWHWPWWAALLGVVPRTLLMMPGLVRTAMARARHPRPLWPAPQALRRENS